MPFAQAGNEMEVGEELVVVKTTVRVRNIPKSWPVELPNILLKH